MLEVSGARIERGRANVDWEKSRLTWFPVWVPLTVQDGSGMTKRSLITKL